MRQWCIFLSMFVCLLLGQAFSATVTGTAYGPDLEKMNKVIIGINSTPAQTIVLANGTYEVKLSNGAYRIDAVFSENTVKYEAHEEIIISEESGRYVIDLILLPDIKGNETLESFEEEQTSDFFEENKVPFNWVHLLGIIIIIGIVTALILHKKLKIKMPSKKERPQSAEELPSDLQELIQLIKRHEGRITQKELRAEIPFSEGKVSLMISDLENRGIVRRIKTGRSNIVVLREK